MVFEFVRRFGEIFVEPFGVLREDTEGVEGPIQSELVRLRHAKAQIFETGLVAEQNGAKRVDRLIGFTCSGIVANLSKTRLRDTVLEAEEDFVGGEVAPVPRAEHGESAGDLSLDAFEMLLVVGVDRRNHVNLRRLIERLGPMLRVARPEIAELQRPLCHPVAELGREHRERFAGRSQRPQPLEGKADIETDGRLLVAPWRLASAPGDARVSARDRYAKEASRRCAVPNSEDEVAYDLPVIAAQDVALNLRAIELVAHQPTPNLRRTSAAENPG